MAFEAIHNYYENQVINRLAEMQGNGELADNEELLNDIACVALNQLPARYIRHDVDMSFYLSMQEREEIKEKVFNAVQMAVEYVQSHIDGQRPNTYTQ